MTVTNKILLPSKFLENAVTTQYTANNCKTLIDSFIVTNDTANNVALTVYLVDIGGTAGASNRFIKSRSIAPGETYKCTEIVGQLLESGGFIATNAGSATALSCRIAGREIV